jgi:multidrug resistance efflux pump
VDVQRKRPKSGKWLRAFLLLTLVGGGIAATTFALSSLKPAVPEFDRTGFVVDIVKQGTLLRRVRGTGTLAPVEITWVTVEEGGVVVELSVKPGTRVTPETVILQMEDPQIERSIREADRLVELAKADVDWSRQEQLSLMLDLKVAVAEAEGLHEDAKADAELDEELFLKRAVSERKRDQSREKAKRTGELLAAERERVENAKVAGGIRERQKQAALSQATDIFDERTRQRDALTVRAGIDGVLQELGETLTGGTIQVGQRLLQGAPVAMITNPRRLKAVLRISQTEARDVAIGQQVEIDTRAGLVQGQVRQIDPAVQNNRVAVEVELTGELPKAARPDLSVEGVIEVLPIQNALYVQKPVRTQEGREAEVFRLSKDGRMATRITVEFGRVSVYEIEVISGLTAGDQIVVSDTSRWDGLDEVLFRNE